MALSSSTERRDRRRVSIHSLSVRERARVRVPRARGHSQDCDDCRTGQRKISGLNCFVKQNGVRGDPGLQSARPAFHLAFVRSNAGRPDSASVLPILKSVGGLWPKRRKLPRCGNGEASPVGGGFLPRPSVMRLSRHSPATQRLRHRPRISGPDNQAPLAAARVPNLTKPGASGLPRIPSAGMNRLCPECACSRLVRCFRMTRFQHFVPSWEQNQRQGRGQPRRA